MGKDRYFIVYVQSFREFFTEELRQRQVNCLEAIIYSAIGALKFD